MKTRNRLHVCSRCHISLPKERTHLCVGCEAMLGNAQPAPVWADECFWDEPGPCPAGLSQCRSNSVRTSDRCATCCHWRRFTADDLHGFCAGIPMLTTAVEEARADTPAFMSPASEGALLTQASFGCRNHDPKGTE